HAVLGHTDRPGWPAAHSARFAGRSAHAHDEEPHAHAHSGADGAHGVSREAAAGHELPDSAEPRVHQGAELLPDAAEPSATSHDEHSGEVVEVVTGTPERLARTSQPARPAGGRVKEGAIFASGFGKNRSRLLP